MGIIGSMSPLLLCLLTDRFDHPLLPVGGVSPYPQKGVERHAPSTAHRPNNTTFNSSINHPRPMAFNLSTCWVSQHECWQIYHLSPGSQEGPKPCVATTRQPCHPSTPPSRRAPVLTARQPTHHTDPSPGNREGGRCGWLSKVESYWQLFFFARP